VLVTGATGFIGAELVRVLLARGDVVRALVRDRDRVLPGVEVVRGDLLDPRSLAGIETDVDVVFHCASLLGKWGTDERVLHAVNVEGSTNVLERFRGTALLRYIHLSAGGVSGPLSGRVVDETYECRPATAYEKSKLLGEQRVLARSRELGLPTSVVRPTFTYGPGDPHKIALFRAVKRGRYAYIGDGESVNHPVYLDDLIHGLLLARERARDGEVYIIGGPRPVTKRELVCTIADTLGVRRPFLRIPRWIATLAAFKLELLGRVLGFEPILTRSRVMMMADDFGYSIDKARRELGYEPRTELPEGLGKTILSYVESGLL
jgi:nucleoside-diphosphate-sugar epimerase